MSSSWPSETHRLFQDATGWMAASLGGPWYSTAYEEALDLLAERIGADPRGSQAEMLTTPLIFLARHTIELNLKDAAITACRLYDDLVMPARPGHALSVYARIVDEALRRLDAADSGHKEFTRLIAEFDAMDPGGTAFRYQTSTRGAPSVRSHRTIDPIAFYDAAKSVIHYLSGAIDYLYDLEGAQPDFE